MNLRLKHLTTKISDSTGTGGNGGNVTVVENKKEIINKIKDFDIEILNKVKELGDKILKFNAADLELISESDLEQLKQEKEKEEKSTPSELIGRIGEELAMKWLEERGLEPEHVAMTRNQYEYDILVPEDETGIERYIDVKTTTKSVIENDASVPLHIHKHAMKFLEAEADRNYFIIRISMGDLGIDHWNTHLKDRFNFKGKDRKLSDELIEAIRVKVNEFWEKPKNQKLFEKTVKEFRLTIPKMVLAEMEN
jgi:Holliday junction resolvase-like predicted endonuclease